jgi:hypothetical protein
MKRILGLSIALAALIIFVGCEEEIALTAPVVDYTVTDNGATLRLTWDEVEDADGYYIYADGAVVATIDEATTTTYSATTPAQVYAVAAYAGDDTSATDEVDCEPEETASLDVYDISEPPPNPSGFGFNSSGTAVTYSLTDTTNWGNIDFYIEDAPQRFFSPHHGGYNNQVNVTQNSGSTEYDTLNIAAAPGGYSSQTDIADGAVYYFWIDPTDNGWDNSTDYFGKIKIEAISGTQITMTLAFQRIAGLRWCMTD